MNLTKKDNIKLKNKDMLKDSNINELRGMINLIIYIKYIPFLLITYLYLQKRKYVKGLFVII